MPGGRIGGQGRWWQRAAWVFISCCIVVAIWNTFPHDPKGFYDELANKAQDLKHLAGQAAEWVRGLVDSQNAATDAPGR